MQKIVFLWWNFFPSDGIKKFRMVSEFDVLADMAALQFNRELAFDRCTELERQYLRFRVEY